MAVNIGIDVIWDNQKQMQQAKNDLIALGDTALATAGDFGKTGTKINKSFEDMLPNIKTSSQALKMFSNEGYLAWVKFQKEVDEGAKGQQYALSKQLKNLSVGFDSIAKSSDDSVDNLMNYKRAMAEVSVALERVAKDNKSVGNSFSANTFLAGINKQKKATAEWGSETVAVAQAMDSIAKKGQALEFVNSTGKQTKNLKLLREEYTKLQSQLNTLSMGKFNKTLQEQYSYTKLTKGEIEALKEKYKSLDSAIRGLISSGDTTNLEKYKLQLSEVSANLNKLEVASRKFDEGGFFTSLDKNTAAIENMDGRLTAVNSRMKVLRTTILKLTETGNANEEQMESLRHEYAKLSEEQKTLQKEANGTGLRIKNLIKSFVSAQAIVWLVRSAFMKLINTFKEASEVAAAAEETMNLFNVVFEGVNDSANEMASTMSKAFGVAQSSISQGLSTLGDFAEGLGMSNREALTFSSTLSQRMMDVISFKNVVGDTTDILKNLASGLAGNTENFRTWGVVIKESSVAIWLAENNMDKLTGTALELAKVQARAALFMEQTTNAAGDMARTFDSTVNIARRLTEANKQLNENMGVEFNKIVTPIRKGALNIVESWNLASASKKAYADIDITGSESDKLTQNNKTIQAYYEASKIRQVEKGETSGAMVFGKYVGQGAGEINFNDFQKMVNALGGSIEDTVASLDDLNISYKQSYIESVKALKTIKEKKRLDSLANEALDSFTETLKSWENTGLTSSITPWQTATGTVPSDTELATSYQSELKAMYETAFNSFIQAQNSGNKALEEKAQTELDTIISQYNEAQKIIDKEAKIAELDAENADALKDAISAFESSMSKITNNISTMTSSINEIMRNAGISASMIGTDSSIVSIAQNRATALSGVRAENILGQQNFSTEHIKAYANLQATTPENEFEDASKKFLAEQKQKWEELIESQDANIKTTNTYYDLLEMSAKAQLGYSDAENDLSGQMVKNYQSIVDAQLTELDQKVKDGEVTQEYYNSVQKIWDENLKTLKSLNLDKIKETLSELGSMSLTSGLNFGTGIFDSADSSYQENMEKLNSITEAVWQISENGISKEDAKILDDSLKAIKDAYETDRQQAYLDATGISSSPDAELFTNISSIMGTATNPFAGLGETIFYIISQFDSFQSVLSIVTDALDALSPLIDSFLAPIMLILEPLAGLLGELLMPILEALFPIIKGIMFVLLPVIAVIRTVNLYLNAFKGMLKDIVTFNWGHIDDNFKDATDKTVEIWTELNSDLKDLADMTLDTSTELSGANSEYVDAINDLLSDGLLTGQEALQMIAKENNSTYTGDNYKYLDKDSYNPYTSGGGTVNVGNISIDAKGKTMEEIFEEIRQLSYESSITGGVAG